MESGSETEPSYRSSPEEYPEETKPFYSANDNASSALNTKYYVSGVLMVILALSVGAALFLQRHGAQRRYERETTASITELHLALETTKTASADRTSTEAATRDEPLATFPTTPQRTFTRTLRPLSTWPRSSSTKRASAETENTWDTQDESSSNFPDIPEAANTVPSVHPNGEGEAEPLTVCVFGAFLRISTSPPADLCTFKVFEHVRVARHKEFFVGVDNQISFGNYMKMAASETGDNFLLSLSTASEFDESLEVQERATAILSRYRAQNIRGYGFARYRVASAGVEIGKLWKHHKMLFNLRYWSKQPITLFLGLQIDHHRSYSEEYLTGLVAEASASMDFVIIVTHVTVPPKAAFKNCQVELIGSWEPEAFNDMRLLSTKEAASVINSTLLDRGVKLPLLLSQSLGVVEYTVERSLKVEEARLRNLKCSNSSLVPFITVCNSTSAFMRGKYRTPTFSHYDDDPKNGRWRTYKTALDIITEIQSVAQALDPSTSGMIGWAFYDIDLEDYRGDCAAHWGSRKSSATQEVAAYYRLSVGASLAQADLRDPVTLELINDSEYALVL